MDILKLSWERYQKHLDLDKRTIVQLIKPHTNAAISKYEYLNNGCANTNIKIIFSDNVKPVLLRIYLRDLDAAGIEHAVLSKINTIIPSAKILYFDNSFKLINHPFAIMDWIDGVLMRDVILKNDQESIEQCAYEAGKVLAKLSQVKFKYGGFFDKNLEVRKFLQEEEYYNFAIDLIKSNQVKRYFDQKDIHKLVQLIEDNIDLIPAPSDANLTHGDYDPANIIVNKTKDNKWAISGVIDWEFTFAGNYVFDVGNFLRYSHKLFPLYQKAFIEGLVSIKKIIPNFFSHRVKIADLLYLLHLLYLNPEEERPNLHNDVKQLVHNTIDIFQKDFRKE